MELASRYRSGQVAPTKIIDGCLKQIEADDVKLGAFELLCTDQASKAANAADNLFARHENSELLLGIPFAIKDIFDVEGYATGRGQKRKDVPVATKSAAVVQSLLSAGAIILGKTKTVEIAMGGWGVNKTLGTPWNPWDKTIQRVPGGSSSGSAVAVAAGFSTFAIGTDTGGSIRLPAAFCGLVGLNVTANCISTEGIMPLSKTFDTPGPITRTVLDAAIVFEVMCGQPSNLIKQHLDSSTGLYGALQSGNGLEGCRLGAINNLEREVCTDEILQAYDSALEDLCRLGAKVEKISPNRNYAEIAANIGDLINSEAFESHGTEYLFPEFPTEKYVRDRVLAGASLCQLEKKRILEERKQIQKEFSIDIRGFDALVTPTTPTTAVPVSEVNNSMNVSYFTRPFNFLGMCALAVPIGITSAGLPTSLQIVARGGHEAVALRIGAAFERKRGSIGNPQIYKKH
ncbi:MAG: amidase [Paracoccaceae bacterium]|nr:amidase [Paracoccaceae bacterium]